MVCKYVVGRAHVLGDARCPSQILFSTDRSIEGGADLRAV